MNRPIAAQLLTLPLLTVLLAVPWVDGVAQNKTAQKKTADKTSSPTLAQAVVVEVYEHDLGKALGLYQAIADDGERPLDERTKARLRLGKVYRRLGQETEAQGCFRQAAQGEGEGAKTAAAILAGENAEDGDLVKAKVEQALAAMRLTGKRDRSDLAWIGQPAVPYVIEAVDKEKADLRFITNAAGVLLQIGGPAVIEWIGKMRKSEDVLRRRAVIKAYHGDSGEVRSSSLRFMQAPDVTVRREVRAALSGFMQDPDVTVRREVVGNTVFILTGAQFVAALQDPDAEVRHRALSAIRDNWMSMDHGGKAFENFVAALPAFEKVTGDLYGPGPDSLSSWLNGHVAVQPGVVTQRSQFPDSEAGGRAVLQAAGLRCLRNCHILWPQTAVSTGKNRYVTEVVQAAKNRGGEPSPTIQAALKLFLTTWDRTGLPAVLELVDLGYDRTGQLAQWIADHGTAADIDAVAQRLARFDSRSGLPAVCQWMTRTGRCASALPQLKVLAERFDRGEKSPNSFISVVNTIRSINTPESIEYIVEALRRGRRQFGCGVDGSGADVRAILQRLLVIPDPDENGIFWRRFAFENLLAKFADPGSPELFVRACEIGLGDPGPAEDPQRSIGKPLFRVFVHGGATEENRARILDACLKTGQREVFVRLSKVSHQLFSGGAGTRIRAAVARNMMQCPEILAGDGEDVRGRLIDLVLRVPNVPGWKVEKAQLDLAAVALAHPDLAVRRWVVGGLSRTEYLRDPRVVAALLARLDDTDEPVRNGAARLLAKATVQVAGMIPAMTRLLGGNAQVVKSAVAFLGHHDPKALLTRADDLLRHRDPAVRITAARALLEAHGVAVIDRVGPILSDEAIPTGERFQLLQPFGSLMDLKVVPYLLQALKVPALQPEAQKQLESVRFFHEQSSRWQQIIAGSGFTQATAVQALVQQTRSTDKDVRLAAIASLGTLGDPESLPVLVELVGNQDPEVARAAKAALARINEAGRRPEK